MVVYVLVGPEVGLGPRVQYTVLWSCNLFTRKNMRTSADLPYVATTRYCTDCVLPRVLRVLNRIEYWNDLRNDQTNVLKEGVLSRLDQIRTWLVQHVGFLVPFPSGTLMPLSRHIRAFDLYPFGYVLYLYLYLGIICAS